MKSEKRRGFDALSPATSRTNTAARAHDVELPVIGREGQAVRIRHLLLGDHAGDGASLVDAIHRRRKLARFGTTLIQTAAVRRIGEPVAAVRVGGNVVRRIQTLAFERLRERRHRSVVLVAHDAAHQVLARNLTALEVERVAVGVVRRRSKHRHALVVLEPAHLPVAGDVAPDEEAALAAPRRPLGPQRAGPQALERRVSENQAVELGIDGHDVGIGIAGRRRGQTEVALRSGRLRGLSADRAVSHPQRPDRTEGLNELPPRHHR
jgi:hypothetical protein